MDRDQQPPRTKVGSLLSTFDLDAAAALADAVERAHAAELTEQAERGQYIRMSADHIPRLTSQAEMERLMQHQYIKRDGPYVSYSQPEYLPYSWTVDLLLLEVTLINRRRAP